VGGDLYDFFLLNEDHLFFAVGDVSGKGVPAALYMAAAKFLMKEHAVREMNPSNILAAANRELCIDNESLMFVTVFCGILNFRTGELRYSNAGHLPPVMIRKDLLRRQPEWLPLPEGFFLGVNEHTEYRTESVILQAGDGLFLYTDGVTEAMNEKQEFYSEARLLEILADPGDATPEACIQKVMHSLEDFTGGAAQSDDITVLAIRFRGSS
jgi:phosphoserine phosphatase RsbU/P